VCRPLAAHLQQRCRGPGEAGGWTGASPGPRLAQQPQKGDQYSPPPGRQQSCSPGPVRTSMATTGQMMVLVRIAGGAVAGVARGCPRGGGHRERGPIAQKVGKVEAAFDHPWCGTAHDLARYEHAGGAGRRPATPARTARQAATCRGSLLDRQAGPVRSAVNACGSMPVRPSAVVTGTSAVPAARPPKITSGGSPALVCATSWPSARANPHARAEIWGCEGSSPSPGKGGAGEGLGEDLSPSRLCLKGSPRARRCSRPRM